MVSDINATEIEKLLVLTHRRLDEFAEEKENLSFEKGVALYKYAKAHLNE
ncbi:MULTISPECIES: hypothetical protein [Staphylococcus]|nr:MULTISPECIES: hypothetical protein [Staphylococcus]